MPEKCIRKYRLFGWGHIKLEIHIKFIDSEIKKGPSEMRKTGDRQIRTQVYRQLALLQFTLHWEGIPGIELITLPLPDRCLGH